MKKIILIVLFLSLLVIIKAQTGYTGQYFNAKSYMNSPVYKLNGVIIDTTNTSTLKGFFTKYQFSRLELAVNKVSSQWEGNTSTINYYGIVGIGSGDFDHYKLFAEVPKFITGDDKYNQFTIYNNELSHKIMNINTLGHAILFDSINYGYKLGIGLNPSYKLDVNGDINISSGHNFKINGVNLSIDTSKLITKYDLTQGVFGTAYLAGNATGENSLYIDSTQIDLKTYTLGSTSYSSIHFNKSDSIAITSYTPTRTIYYYFGNKGLHAGGDYSSLNTADSRWMPDKAYVDATAISPFSTLTIASDSTTWDCSTGLNKTVVASASFTMTITNFSSGMFGDAKITLTNTPTITMSASGVTFLGNGSLSTLAAGVYHLCWVCTSSTTIEWNIALYK